jgi:hypothetical protein
MHASQVLGMLTQAYTILIILLWAMSLLLSLNAYYGVNPSLWSQEVPKKLHNVGVCFCVLELFVSCVVSRSCKVRVTSR